MFESHGQRLSASVVKYAVRTEAQSRIRSVVAAPNYSYEKRQRELAKKRKQEDKRNKKANPRPDGEPEAPVPADGSTPSSVQPGAPESTT